MSPAALIRAFGGFLIVMKLLLFLILILLSAAQSVAQTHFYLDEPFKYPAKIPDGVVPLLRDEIKEACPGETVTRGTAVKSWFSASRINLNGDSSALILKSSKYCLTGADNNWFWIFLKTVRGYRLVLTAGTISVAVLRTKSHGLRDIETNVATARTNHMNVYRFNGSVYRPRICTEATPVEAKPKRVPCRTQ
jgi:hypothetical protein